MVCCSHNTVRSSLMKQRWKNTSCWTRQMLKNRNAIHLWEQWVQGWQWCHASVSTTYRHLPQRPFVFSRSSSPRPWQQLNMRGAFLLWKGSKLCWESPWHRIVLMLWLCSPWRRNSTETFKNKVNKRFSTQTERRTKFLHKYSAKSAGFPRTLPWDFGSCLPDNLNNVIRKSAEACKFWNVYFILLIFFLKFVIPGFYWS